MHITSETAGKIAYSNTINKFIKRRVATELDNLIKVSKFLRWEKDFKNHPFTTLGFNYYETKIVLGEETYIGVLNIGLSEKGKMLYDINPIKKL